MLVVCIATVSAFHSKVNGQLVGRNNLVVKFLHGARQLNPSHPSTIPTWDLTLVLMALTCSPFEPLESALLKVLSFKTALLLALMSVK